MSLDKFIFDIYAESNCRGPHTFWSPVLSCDEATILLKDKYIDGIVCNTVECVCPEDAIEMAIEFCKTHNLKYNVLKPKIQI